MSVQQARRRGPLPADIEFACLDGAAAGWSQVEQDLDERRRNGGAGGGDSRDKDKGKRKEGYVEIVPSVRMPVIESLDGPHTTYGPLIPPQKAWVPLWLAVHLKKKRKCRVVAPQWMTVGYLEDTLKAEQTQGEFSDLPRDYLEVSKVLLETASDDLASPDRIRLLLKDIREARQAKVRDGLGAINPVHLGMPNISAMEIAELRPFFSLAFTRLKDLDPAADQHRETEEWWMRDPGGCMDAVRTGQLRAEREGTAVSAFAGL